MKTNGLGQRLVLAGVLAVGFVVAWGLVSSWAGEAVTRAGRPDQAQEYLYFLGDGTPRITRQPSNGYSATEFYDLEGNRVAAPSEETGGSLSLRPLAARQKQEAGHPIASWQQQGRFVQDGGDPPTFWYFLCDASQAGAYFVGYDSVTKHCVGYLGTSGFREDLPPAAERFPVDRRAPALNAVCLQSQDGGYTVVTGIVGAVRYSSVVPSGPAPRGSLSETDFYVLTPGGTLYRADLRQRTVAAVLDRPDLCCLRLSQMPHEPGKGRGFRLAARAADAVLVLDERGAVVKQFAIPEPLRGHQFSFGETSTGEAVMHRALPHGKLATTAEHHVYWVSSEGGVRSLNVTLPAPGMPTSERVLAGFIFPTPLGLVGGFAVGHLTGTMIDTMGGTVGQSLSHALNVYWPGLVLGQLIAAACAGLCYRRQVRYGQTGRERFAWPLFVLLMGLPGWVGYRFGRTWPALEACPACGADAPQNRAECHLCDAEFPLPALKGTEVFA